MADQVPFTRAWGQNEYAGTPARAIIHTSRATSHHDTSGPVVVSHRALSTGGESMVPGTLRPILVLEGKNGIERHGKRLIGG